MLIDTKMIEKFLLYPYLLIYPIDLLLQHQDYLNVEEQFHDTMGSIQVWLRADVEDLMGEYFHLVQLDFDGCDLQQNPVRNESRNSLNYS